MSLASTVAKLSEPREVTRRTAATYDGTSPRPSAAGSEVTASVSLAIQRQPPSTLVRDFDGDQSGGAARVWVTTAALSAAYDVDEELEEGEDPTALNWTALQIAPPEDGEGPPGDVIAWEGRRWEITEFQGWDKGFRGPPRFLRYKATDRGVAA